MLSLTPWSGIFEYAFMRNALLAGTLVAIVAGVVGYFVVLRRLAFAGHALAHIGFAGATGAVLLNINLFVGLAAFTTGAGIAMGILGDKLRGRDVAIGTVLALTMGLGNLFLTLSTKLAGEATSILFGDLPGPTSGLHEVSDLDPVSFAGMDKDWRLLYHSQAFTTSAKRAADVPIHRGLASQSERARRHGQLGEGEERRWPCISLVREQHCLFWGQLQSRGTG